MREHRVPIAELKKGERALDRDASHYLVRVLRLDRGARFVAFDPETRMEADATLIDAAPHTARVMIDVLRPAAVVANTELVIVYALTKGDKIDAVVRDATELGATRVIIAKTERCVVKVSKEQDVKDGRNKRDRWNRIAEQAARQCGRADPPAIDSVHAWPDALDRAASSCMVRFCLDPRAIEPLGGALRAAFDNGGESSPATIAFAIGPEGGLTADEIEIAIGKGFTPVTLGPFVLRTETVAAAVLGAVRVLASS